MESGESKKVNSTSNHSAAPINHPRINGLLGINENGKTFEKKDKIDKCNRFTLKLFLPDDKAFPEFDYNSLLKGLGIKNACSDNTTSGALHFPDDTDDLRALAQKFEEKYAPKKKESSKKYKNEFVDAGYGYDESDTFIDNTEAYDEVVPSDWTTEHGGFYINQGNLDFRPCEKFASDATKKENTAYKKKKKKTLDGKPIQKNAKQLSTQKKKKHLLHKEKQRIRQESLQKATKILAKKIKKVPVFIDDSSQDIPLAMLNKSADKNKENHSTSQVSVDTSFEDNIPLAKIAKSSPASVLSSKTTNKSNSPLTNSASNQIPTCSATTISEMKVTSSLNSVPAKTGNEKTSSQLPTAVTKKDSSDTTEEVKTSKLETPLPEGLSKQLLDDVEKLKTFAETYVKGKGFFTAEVNMVMLCFARSCRQLSPKIRNAVYDHMLCFLPCARDTLVKRCRRLIVQHQREMEDEPIRILKEGIDESMLEQKKEYEEEVAEALQEQAREQIKQTGVDPMKSEVVKSEDNETNDDDEKKSVDDSKKYFPKKKYTWTEEIRKLLCNVVKVRVGLFKMSKSKSLSAEEYIKDFLESEIRKLWPKGWMTSRILYKESRATHQEITQPGKGKNRFTKLPCGYPIANLTVGESTSSTPPYILKSGPKTLLSTAATTNTTISSSTFTNSPLNTPSVARTHVNNSVSTSVTFVATPVTLKTPIGTAMIDTISQQPQSHTIKTVIPKSVIKTVSSVSNARIVATTTNPSNFLTISKNTSTKFSSAVISNPSYTLPTSTTVVTWNTTSLVSTPSTSSHKKIISNKIPANLKVADSSKTPAQINSRFAETVEKTSFLKSNTSEDTAKQNTLKVDTLLSLKTDCSESSFHSNNSTVGNFNRNNIQQRTTVVSHYAISPTFIHPPKSMHNESINNEMYYRQVKRKLPVEVNDARITSKRNISDSVLNHSSKSLEGKSWSEIECDLVRLSQEAPRKVKEECPSPDPGCKSPEHRLKGKEWCLFTTSPSSHIHMSHTNNVSQLTRSPEDAIVKPIANRTLNISRSVEQPKFDTNILCRKSLPVASNQNKYVLSSKQLSPQLYQQSAALPAYTSRKSSQLSINSSCSKNSILKANLHDYPSPQHPASRIQMSKSDHQYSTSLENNIRLLTDPHNSSKSPLGTMTKHDSQPSNDNQSTLCHSPHINQQQPIHGIHMQGKFIGIQPISQSTASQQTHSRLSLKEQLKTHNDGRNIRSEQDYQSKFGTYAPRFS